VDTAFDPAQLRIGRRLAIKVLNAGRFVLGLGPGAAGQPDSPASQPDSPAGQDSVTEPIDLALLRHLATVTQRCTAAFDDYDHAAALEHAERCFWFFCDDYLELVKARAYGEHGEQAAASAVAALRLGLSVLLRLLAPVLPFVTEEVWSWWQDGSIHRAAWPSATELLAQAGPGDDGVLTAAAAAIAAIRRAKSQARLAMKDPVPLLIVTAGKQALDALAAASEDVRSAGRVAAIDLRHPADATAVSGGADASYEVVLDGLAAR
jgi:valyl-tRNA synthetase